MTTAQQVEGLLALVEADRAAKCARILGAAREQAAAIRRDAHAAARERMQAMFAEERERRDARVAAAQANLETRRRIASQQRSAALLAAAWAALPGALAARWRREEGRAAWVAGLLADARRVLAAREWRIVHAEVWPQPERDALAAALAAEGVAVAFEEDPGLGAGLKIAAGGNVADATREGLLADRGEIGALLLARFEEAP